MTGGAPGPGRARKRARGTGGGPGPAFSRSAWTSSAHGVNRGALLASGLGPARGRAQGGSQASQWCFLSSLFPGWFTWRPQPQCARPQEVGAGVRGSVVVGGGGCVCGGGSLSSVGQGRRHQTASSFPW